MEHPKLSIPKTNKTPKVNLCVMEAPHVRESDFTIFFSHHSHMKNCVNHVTAIVNTERYRSVYSTL